MNISALLTSAGINIAISVSLLSLYSILRKQPSNVSVYFGKKLASMCDKRNDPFSLERFVPSPSWILKAWETTEAELLELGGLDAVVFIRIVVFRLISMLLESVSTVFHCGFLIAIAIFPLNSIRIFCIAAVICIFLVLPVNYYGKDMIHKKISSESLEVFTIANVKEGSKWLWAHCLALYIISCSACFLLYFEYKSITKMRLAYITRSILNPSHFTVLVRAVPWSPEQSYSDSVREYFMNYYASSYLSHQMVYRSGTVQKLMNDAEKMCRVFKHVSSENSNRNSLPCHFCGVASNPFMILSSETESEKGNVRFDVLDLAAEKEYATAFVFFKTRYDTIVASEVLQSANPMLWVTEMAPEPRDVYWSNLCIPYKQLWIRKIATLLAAIVFMFVFLIPVTFVQGLTQLDQLSHALPFLRGLFKKKYVTQVVTGYLPSVVLILFLYAVPPTMMLFSTIEGAVSHSGRKKSTCIKVLYFTIWNVFFVNVLSGSIIGQLSVFSSVKDIPKQLAEAVPIQATFFMTYVLTSGWASLSVEIMQPFILLCNILKKFIFQIKEDPPDGTLSFPYHTEVPRVLLFGLIGFVCSILAPLILPLLLIYFLLAYLVYRNQIMNVYITNYESGGQYWPIAHKSTIFALVLTQIIALGVFGIKRSSVASGFIIPLIIGTLLFNAYCSQRFSPTFDKLAAQDFMEMDRRDQQDGRMEEIYKQLRSAYSQFRLSQDLCKAAPAHINHNENTCKDVNTNSNEDQESIQDSEAALRPGTEIGS
ncbi:CSC1-like protein RXW8 isoform X2 [Pistacia vera]|uniref:CSC1-like protein RXW8 isoform X2 n=1 Tax=Pistacia vera TaxID=55513 RepID=UPI001262F890|nr:CSC1-like protein RXW8 isoform X2 [Pistacia vera]